MVEITYNKLKGTSDTWKTIFVNTITAYAMAVSPENYRKFRTMFPLPKLERGYDLFRVPNDEGYETSQEEI